eukprot:NODE_546_length_1977_cov_25.780602_g438_i0.p1 GENE.NODE_546_length_1977_cov_25.780602_g438_i0~~NODE_546_length_1977_cov_25.780602_g438_i0.p1  ORF type:complete len:616 (-),score=151.92 NODE_546_length_1977_cov_25.780602_g438_i0:130-1935(-)
MLGTASTGSGKTLAYLLPAFRHILDQPGLVPFDGPIVLVMVPTRELANQINHVANTLGKAVGIRAGAAYGGINIAHQIAAFKRGVHIAVVTPGRWIEMLTVNKGKVTNMTRVTMVVLDEGDRLFDMGFGPQIAKIVSNIRPDRQMVMFSATFPKEVKGAARKYLLPQHQPLVLEVGGRASATKNVEQIIEVYPSVQDKFRRLLSILGSVCVTVPIDELADDEMPPGGSVIIFLETKEDCENLFAELCSPEVGWGPHTATFHGGMEQAERSQALHDFRAKRKHVLISTSVASRGLDVYHVEAVVNYEPPSFYEDYVHRVGRTGRAGRKGKAYTFLLREKDRKAAPFLVKALKLAEVEIPPDLEEMNMAHWQEVSMGQVALYRPGGYKQGRGFTFDEAERRQKHINAKEQLAKMGLDSSNIDLDLEDDEEAKRQAADAAAEHARNQVARKEALQNQIVLRRGTPGVTPRKLSPAEEAELKVQQALRFAEIVNKKQEEKKVLEKQGIFMEEVEVNDWPIIARTQVTKRETLENIQNETGAQLRVSGEYHPPGRKTKGITRKLFIGVCCPVACLPICAGPFSCPDLCEFLGASRLGPEACAEGLG